MKYTDEAHKTLLLAANSSDPEECVEYLCQLLDRGGWDGIFNFDIVANWPLKSYEFPGYQALRAVTKTGKRLFYRGENAYLLEYHGSEGQSGLNGGTTPPWFKLTKME
jgi:hypothetical protein